MLIWVITSLTEKHPKKMRKELYAKRALKHLNHYIKEVLSWNVIENF
jgi:hypothetical protein